MFHKHHVYDSLSQPVEWESVLIYIVKHTSKYNTIPLTEIHIKNIYYLLFAPFALFYLRNNNVERKLSNGIIGV